MFSKLREIEYQIYQQNVFPKLVITDNSKAIIQAVLNELNREILEEYLKRTYGIIFEDQKTENTQKTQIRLCSYHILRNNFENLKELPKDNSQMNFAQRVLGRLICCKSYAEAETIILNAAIVMTTPKTDYDLKKAITNIEQTVNTFDLPKQEDLPLLNTGIEFDGRIQISESDGWTHHFDKLLSTTTTSLANLSDKESITNKYYLLPKCCLQLHCGVKDSFLQCDIPQTVSNGVNSDSESCWEDLDIKHFEESFQERKSPINLRRKTSHLRPPSKKIKFDFNKKSGETKKKTKRLYVSQI